LHPTTSGTSTSSGWWFPLAIGGRSSRRSGGISIYLQEAMNPRRASTQYDDSTIKHRVLFSEHF
jgi:hypothetical protein